jgi:hypothetical protein
MATVSELNTAERIVLPFAAVIPVAMGVIGYVIWKKDKRRQDGTSMTDKMRVFFVANSAALCSMTVFHVLHTLFSAYDYRWGMAAFALGLVVCVCLGIRFEALRIFEDNDILLNQHNETGEFMYMDGERTGELMPETNDAVKHDATRKIIAAATYVSLLVQSGFDGLILKYNPNAQSSALQVRIREAMFWGQNSNNNSSAGRDVLPVQIVGIGDHQHGSHSCSGAHQVVCVVHVQLHRGGRDEHVACV